MRTCALILLLLHILAGAQGGTGGRRTATEAINRHLATRAAHPEVAPFPPDGGPVRVRVLFLLLGVAGVSAAESAMSAVLAVDAFWLDARLAWTAAVSGANETQVRAGRLWRPELVLPKVVEGDAVLEMNAHAGRLFVDRWGYVLMSFHRTLKFSCAAHIRRFPSDSLTCRLPVMSALSNDTVDVAAMAQTPSEMRLADTALCPGSEWELVGLSSATCVCSNSLLGSPYHLTGAELVLELRRRPLPLAVGLVAPACLLAALAGTSPLIPPGAGDRMGLPVASGLSQALLLLLLMHEIPVARGGDTIFGLSVLAGLLVAAVNICETLAVTRLLRRGHTLLQGETVDGGKDGGDGVPFRGCVGIVRLLETTTLGFNVVAVGGILITNLSLVI